tara:strand:+ start:3493 stop:3696 length:204 start_codon:yes stop_codon:yes gene_type:complete
MKQNTCNKNICNKNICNKNISNQEEKDKKELEIIKKQWKEVCKNHFKLLEKENNKKRIIKEYNNDDN